MADLEFLQGRIAGYADYGDGAARHHVDKQMRAYLGEALAAVRERLRPTGPLGEQIEGLILRCEFSDQRVIQAADHARFGREQIDRIHALDRQIVETADRVREITSAEELGPLLDEAARALDERFGALSAESPGSTAGAS